MALVKEYLKLQNYVVRTETKFKIRTKDSRGVNRTCWGEIDILALTIQDNLVYEAIVGKVKGEYKTIKKKKTS